MTKQLELTFKHSVRVSELLEKLNLAREQYYELQDHKSGTMNSIHTANQNIFSSHLSLPKFRISKALSEEYEHITKRLIDLGVTAIPLLTDRMTE